ncbi:hypothetical protein D9M71_764080 [compost metagenome]
MGEYHILAIFLQQSYLPVHLKGIGKLKLVIEFITCGYIQAIDQFNIYVKFPVGFPFDINSGKYHRIT